MLGVMEWIRAVGRITVGDGSHGTCFLIAPEGFVLTAFHVVAHHKQSFDKRAPVWRPGPYEIVFGDPNTPATLWQAGAAKVSPERFSIDHDWAMLEVGKAPDGLMPLQLADYELPRADNAFATFGFPTVKAQIGGVYYGTVLNWQAHAKLVELDAANLEADAKGGEDAGGISGAPCVVDNRAVAIVTRSLANQRGQAVTRSLYAVPLARAADSLKGLVEWDDGKPVVFQKVVERKLPSDTLKLEAAAGVLGMPGVREKSPIARRMLATRIETARDALIECDLEAAAAGPILERVAAMRLNADAVAKVRTPLVRDDKPVAALAMISGRETQVHKWFVQRAYADRPQAPSGDTIVVLRSQSTAAELASGTPFDAIVARTRKELRRRKRGSDLVDELLSPTRVDGINPIWLVLVGENRPDVISEARDKLPNVQIVLALGQAMTFPAPHEDLAAPVYPVMSDDEQRKLVRSWQDAASLLDVPIEMEVDA
jgi:hypothetical protein